MVRVGRRSASSGHFDPKCLGRRHQGVEILVAKKQQVECEEDEAGRLSSFHCCLQSGEVRDAILVCTSAGPGLCREGPQDRTAEAGAAQVQQSAKFSTSDRMPRSTDRR